MLLVTATASESSVDSLAARLLSVDPAAGTNGRFHHEAAAGLRRAAARRRQA
jgi:hypothetical protein